MNESTDYGAFDDTTAWLDIFAPQAYSPPRDDPLASAGVVRNESSGLHSVTHTPSNVSTIPIAKFVEMQIGKYKDQGLTDESVYMKQILTMVQKEYGQWMTTEKLHDLMDFYRGEWNEKHRELVDEVAVQMYLTLPKMIWEQLTERGFQCEFRALKKYLDEKTKEITKALQDKR